MESLPLAREAGDFTCAPPGLAIMMIQTPFSACMNENGNNHTNWANEAYDQILREAAAEQDPDARKQLFQGAEAPLLEELPVIPIYFYVSRRLIQPSVKAGIQASRHSPLSGNLSGAITVQTSNFIVSVRCVTHA